MINENLNLEEITAARRHALEASLRTITCDELKNLPDVLIPKYDHPYLEQYLQVVSDPANGPFYHGDVGDRIEVLYCENKHIGIWYIRGTGMGRLQPDQLAIIRDVARSKGHSQPAS